MAKKRMRRTKKRPWSAPKWTIITTIIGFLIGLIALFIDVFFLVDAPGWLQNIINWSVGIGFVGGIITFIGLIVRRAFQGWFDA